MEEIKQEVEAVAETKSEGVSREDYNKLSESHESLVKKFEDLSIRHDRFTQSFGNMKQGTVESKEAEGKTRPWFSFGRGKK